MSLLSTVAEPPAPQSTRSLRPSRLEQHVGVLAAEQRVDGAAAGDLVGARPALERVGVAVADDHVVARAGRNVLDVGAHVVVLRGRAVAGDAVERDPLVLPGRRARLGVRHTVEVGAAGEVVGTRAAGELVGARAAVEAVVAGPAVERVRARRCR